MVEGILLGFVTLAGFAVIYKRLPKGVQVFFTRHPLFTDVVIAVLFYSVMGFTITAHIAAASMTLGAMLLLEIARNPEKYEFIIDAKTRAIEVWNQALTSLQEANKRWKAGKDLEKPVT